MCGILASTTNSPDITLKLHNVFELLKNRGSDYFKEISSDNMLFAASVLQNQGIDLSKQPCVNDKGSVLLFNGDLFMDFNEGLSTESDTKWLFEKCLQTSTDYEFGSLMQSLKGPYSIIYYNKTRRSLYFSRDPIGRNSLLISKINDDDFILASVLDKEFYTATELPPLGVFVFEFDTKEIKLYSWYNLENAPFHKEKLKCLEKSLCKTITIGKQILTVPFHLPYRNTISSFTFNDLLDLQLNDDMLSLKQASLICEEVCLKMRTYLEKSIKERVLIKKDACNLCYKPNSAKSQDCAHAKISILFSGGLDCSVIAALAHQYVDIHEPIDLLNVAFAKPCSNVVNDKENLFSITPDRITGLQTYEELATLYPNRKWNLVIIDVDRDELDDILKSRLRNLTHPLQTVLDESLSAAFWFASRGQGKLNGEYYKSTARIILLGTGADEIFAGYSRHRKCFMNHGEDGLITELRLESHRLPYRNLARDDRVISDHNVTARAPYLEENFLHYVNSLKVHQKCQLNLHLGLGDKLLLRVLAYNLNLKKCCFQKKRAIQFGSRIANKKQNAKDTSIYFAD